MEGFRAPTGAGIIECTEFVITRSVLFFSRRYVVPALSASKSLSRRETFSVVVSSPSVCPPLVGEGPLFGGSPYPMPVVLIFSLLLFCPNNSFGSGGRHKP